MKVTAAGLLFCLAITWVFESRIVDAQRGPAPVRPGWQPRDTKLNELPATERAPIEARLLEVERVLQRIPLLANPSEFVVRPWLSAYPSNDQQVIASDYSLAFSPAPGLESQASIVVSINPQPWVILHQDQGSGLLDERGDTIFMEQDFGEPRPDATHVYGKMLATTGSSYLVLMTSGRVSPFLPVTREEYLNALIQNVEGRRPGEVKKSPLQGLSAPVRAKLASLTPDERRAEVWLASGADFNEFLAPNAPNAFHAVRRNPAFYRPRRSPTEARGISVRFSAGSNVAMRAAVYQAATTLDWSALAALLEPAR